MKIRGDFVEILFSDNDIIAVNKPFGISSGEDGVMKLVRDTLAENGEKTDIFPVHRLDSPTTGVIVFARNQKSAAAISKAITDDLFKKEYVAVVSGECPQNGVFEDELFFDRHKNKSFVQTKKRGGTKHAELSFEKIESVNGLSLVRVKLKTGRTHQIRVQFAFRKLPLFGDGKYGSKLNGNLALHCAEINFPHPAKRTNVHITSTPDIRQNPWKFFLYYNEVNS